MGGTIRVTPVYRRAYSKALPLFSKYPVMGIALPANYGIM